MIKNTKAMTIGAINFPNNSPSFIQILFKVFNKLGLKNTIIRIMNESIIDQIFIGAAFNNGHKPIIKKKLKKSSPKFFSEEVLIISIYSNKKKNQSICFP